MSSNTSHNVFFDSSKNVIIATGGFGVDINRLNLDPIESTDDIIIGTGGFDVDISFQKVENLSYLKASISDYDITNSLHLKFDVRVLNNKLGLYKDSTNTSVISTLYDQALETFPYFSIDVSYSEFVNVISESDIISLGSFEQIYSDFNYQVKRYFHFPNDALLFDNGSRKIMNKNEFTKAELIRKFYDVTIDENGNASPSFTGNFNIYDVNTVLKVLVESDPFSNRGNNNYTMQDGFIAGDKILVLPGVTFDMAVVLHNSFSLNLQELSMNLRQSSNEISPSLLFEKHYRTPLLLELVNSIR